MSVDVPEQVQDPIAAQVPVARRRRRPFVAGFASGLWSLLVAVALVTALVMLVWATSPNTSGDSVAAWRAVGLVWLGAHQVGMEIGGRPLTLLPLGGVLLGLLLTRRGGVWAARLLPDPTPGEVGGILAGAAVAYGLGSAGIAWLSGTGGTAATPGQAFTAAAAVAVAGTAWGISREADLVGQVRQRVTDAAWRTVLAGTMVVISLVAVGAALTALSLFHNGGQASLTLADLDAGVVGGLAVTVLDALCLPTLAIWGMSLVVGPGFSLGSTGSLSAFGGQVDALPALPVLAAIPTTSPAWARFLLLVPIALGVLAGRLRWGRDLPTLSGALAGALGVGAVVAAGCTGLALLASGSVGGGRLEQVGPRALPVAAAAAGLVMLGFLAEAAYQSLRLTWELHQAEQRALSRQSGGTATDDADGPGATSVEADAQGGAEVDVARHAGEPHPDPIEDQPTGELRVEALPEEDVAEGGELVAGDRSAVPSTEVAGEGDPASARSADDEVSGDDAGVDQVGDVGVVEAGDEPADERSGDVEPVDDAPTTVDLTEILLSERPGTPEATRDRS